MITTDDIHFNVENSKDIPGLAIVFVIDGQCVYDLFANKYGTELLMKNNGIIDLSNEYPDHDGITVKIIMDEQNFEILQTSEYVGSILLTPHKAICPWDYPYGIYVQSPYATFDGKSFNIEGKDMNSLEPYLPERPYTSSEFFLHHNI
jgi:hypothetical protein